MRPSGSGKSTLMHILGCLDFPTEGSYELGGVDVSGMDEAALANVRNAKIGFCLPTVQPAGLAQCMAQCRAAPDLCRHPPGERRQMAEAALERVGLGDRLEHRPLEMSGGQQQRVSVARALVTDPDLILADEPTGNLDSVATQEVLNLFRDLHEQGRTVLIIPHEPEVAAEAARVVHIKDGELRAQPRRRAPAPRHRPPARPPAPARLRRR
ncbi:ABC transporter ATP-binding protein [Leekyejoonella antrihumi]